MKSFLANGFSPLAIPLRLSFLQLLSIEVAIKHAEWQKCVE
ncbi:MAG: hypothetical protein QXW47_02205 [Candidatus Jordarchaeales archaeon]